VNLPRIDRPLTSAQLRDRVLAQMNGESRELSAVDRERSARVIDALRRHGKGRPA